MVVNTLKDAKAEDRLVQSRVTFVVIFIFVLSLVLIGRVWFLQVYNFERFSSLSEDNRVNILPLSPDRGEIRDRQGKIGVLNNAK